MSLCVKSLTIIGSVCLPLQYCMQLMPMPVTTLLTSNGTPSNPTGDQSTKLKSTKMKSMMLRASCLTLWGKNRGEWNGRQSPGVEPRTPLAWATSALPLSHDSQTTTNPHNPLYVLHRWYWIPQLHIWQSLSMCRQNSNRGWPEIISIRKEPMLSGFLTLNARSILPHAGNKWI